MLKKETIADLANELHGLPLDDGRAAALADHVARLNSLVRASASQLARGDEPAQFARMLALLKRPAGT
ncbi:MULTISPECIES: hypothetical protein [Bradyrhizobium]|jgi:hypothetical protein|uniref:hypothetical protein n=1 Tax=Bradyrhizobium TaxID=374 RepID=UPI0004B8D9DC|nr:MULTISPECIES: hypothetical protein [Bradyrhizobium]NLS70263.1 hypothetical protein [Bradyrhizobium brasilense]QOZ15540.1 hypothetical protein XI02_11465 [Bradyrhizobium sp. CCBAU 21365]WLA46688.1 hypothetical protein QIH80_33820 [Bradyrhizobium elkanii]WLA84846.1 hypothetical protein QNJ99_11690 [Bradyrhizobium elkanii]WLB83028.1 hypothetical protein QIH83_10915 [Bradyrhizobium elkanii]